MRKNKAKTAIQKRRARAKAKSRQKEKERENWVQDRIDWVKFSDLHDHDFDFIVRIGRQLDVLERE